MLVYYISNPSKRNLTNELETFISPFLRTLLLFLIIELYQGIYICDKKIFREDGGGGIQQLDGLKCVAKSLNSVSYYMRDR